MMVIQLYQIEQRMELFSDQPVINTGMGRLQQFPVRLVGRAGVHLDSVIVLAENAWIAIYRAASLAIEAGARDFEMIDRPFRQ